MREFMKIVEGFIGTTPARSFGRRGVPAQPTDPVNPAMLRGVQVARKYASAEEYADDNNPIDPENTDPAHIHQNYADERQRLIRQWNLWKESGYL